MLHVAEVDLAADRGSVLPRGRTLLLVRDGAAVLGELLHDDPGGVPASELASTCAEAVAPVLAARRRVVGQATGLYGPADVTVVVCTRDRPDLLRDCLRALDELAPAPRQVIVVDSASREPVTAAVARGLGVTLLREEVPGLDRARNRGWQEATGDLVAYVDDDARVDRHWAQAVAQAFFDPAVGMVTGLVLPLEIETRAQRFFERNGGMRRGLERQQHHRDVSAVGLSVEQLGVGTNMAFRKDVLAHVGGFDPALDVGTATEGGGDLEMFHRVLAAGHTAIYEPQALVRHLHRRDLRSWWRQMRGNGRGYAAYLEAVALRHPEQAGQVMRHRLQWHLRRHGRGLVRAALARDAAEVLERVAEASGSASGRRAYRAERRRLATSSTDVA